MIVKRTDKFQKVFDNLDNSFKGKIMKQIEKIIHNPEIGKPMKYNRRETRELYAKPFRISYSYFKNELIILFIDIYHKDEQ